MITMLESCGSDISGPYSACATTCKYYEWTWGSELGLSKRTQSHVVFIIWSRELLQANAKVFYRLSSCSLEESLSVSIRTHKEISDQLSLIVGMMTPSRSFPNDSTGMVTALNSSSRDFEAGWPGVDSNLSQARTGEGVLGEPPTGTRKLSENRLAQRSISIQNSSPNFVKQQCQALCSCICHTRSSFKSPWILETIIGKIDVQYVGRRPACNEFHCRRSPESSFKMVYQFPKYIMSRYISMIVQDAPLSGPEFLLRVPRMVSWTHMLWKYAKNGHLSAIQKLFAEGKASPYDLNPHGSNTLVYTANRHHFRVLNFLLEQGVDMDHPNQIGRTPSDLLWECFFAGKV